MLNRKQFTALLGLLFIAFISTAYLLLINEVIVKNPIKEDKPGKVENVIEETEADVVQPNTAIVTEIIDGDTIKVKLIEEEVTIRIAGIDTPEIHNPKVEDECYGIEAAQALEARLPIGSEVNLETDSKQSDKDRYGRLIRYIIYEDQDVGAGLIKDGYAEVYKEIETQKSEEYLSLETLAKNEQIGVWEHCQSER